jgi:hypothetical protein
MSDLSKSPERGTFQLNNYIKSKEAAGEEPSADYIEMYKSAEAAKLEREQEPEWAKDNMEYDLRSTPWILEKVRSSEKYAQNLYAALCNNDFQKRDVLPILTNKTWGCSWRYAGGILADMREEGDYMDWYCSGINDGGTSYSNGYVSESVVTDEIEADLKRLGWNVVDSTYSGETDV